MMSNANGVRAFLAVSVLLLLLMIAAIESRAHGDKHPDSSSAQADSVAADQIPLRDSIYAGINQSYLNVKPIFKEKCFDCHSTATKYPWYHSLPIIGSFLDDHIKHGLEHIDFSNDFPFKSKENLIDILVTLKEEVEENDMPPFSYRLLHWGMTIDGVQQDSVLTWIDQTITSLRQFKASVSTEQVPSDDDSVNDDDD